MKKQRKNINKDKRVCEQNQNITKQYAVSYAMLAYNYLHPDENGLYCRISTVVDAPTHYNMTKAEYDKFIKDTSK